MSLCEWDPEKNAPAVEQRSIAISGGMSTYSDGWERISGCQREATLSVGANGEWHLCEKCAALPAFKRYRNRAPVSRLSLIQKSQIEEPALAGDDADLQGLR